MFRYPVLAIVMLTALCATSISLAKAPTPKAMRVELEAMLDSDQRFRTEIQSLERKLGPETPEIKALWDRQSRIDQANMKRLAKFISARGWPGKSLVGEKATTAAFLILQHADLPVQQRYLPLLRKAAANNELKPSRLALLEDRILVRTGQPQIYGSQLGRDPKTGLLAFSPIEDEANVDKRREAVGLEPLAEYAKGFGLVYPPKKAD